MFGVRVLRLLAVPRGHDERHPAPLRGRVARRRPGDPRPTAPPASRGLHRRNPALPAAGRAPADHRSRPRQHVAHVPEPVLAAARGVLPPRARRRPLLRHELPHSLGRGPGPDRHRVQGRARSRERAGTLITSLVEFAPPTPDHGCTGRHGTRACAARIRPGQAPPIRSMSLRGKERNLDKGSVFVGRARRAGPPRGELSLIRVGPAGTLARSGGVAAGVGCSVGLETAGATTARERERTACQPSIGAWLGSTGYLGRPYSYLVRDLPPGRPRAGSQD